MRTEIAERVLNHARERIEATYDVHDYIDEKREALEKWAAYLGDLRTAVNPAGPRQQESIDDTEARRDR